MSIYKSKFAQSKKRKSLLALVVIFSMILLIAVPLLQNSFGKDLAEIEVIGAPRIKVANETIDYGNVNLGKIIRTSIEVTNVGDQILEFIEPPYIELLEGC